MFKSASFSAILLAALVLAACGAAKSPTSPSTPEGGGSGTIVSGTVRTGSPLLADSAGAAISGLVVTVLGTSISSGVDAAGRFTLSDVPTGDVELKFSGGGVDSTVRLTQLVASESVALVVSVAGAAVTVDSEIRTSSSSEQLEGRIESLPPTTAAGTLVVAGKTVKTDSATRIEQGGGTKSFSDLLIGMRVHVEGVAAGSDMRATLIRIQNTTTWTPVEVNGVIDSLTGTATMFQFKIGSRVIKGDNLTTFFGDSSQSFSLLKDGVRVEVKGQQRDGYVYAERLHVNVDDTNSDGNGPDDSASIQGVLTAIRGTKPLLTMTVGETLVRTTASQSTSVAATCKRLMR